MSDRLQFFREQMAAFEGTSDPQKAIEKGYFIQQPRNSLASTIANRIALRPSSSHLLTGGIGLGKTTQLLMARDHINEIGDTHAVYVDASLYTDISEIQPGALIAIFGLVLSDILQDKESYNFFKRQSYGYIEQKERIMPEVSISNFGISELIKPHVNIKHEGVLKKKPENKKSKDIIQNLRNINKKTKKKPIIIIDGLDKLNDTLSFSNLVDNDIPLITESGMGIILICSLSTAYSQYRVNIEQQFNYCYHQPCFDVSKDGEALDFFNDILIARLKQRDFIDSTTKYNLINYSGGILRDLINLTQAAIEEAYISDSDNVEQQHVERAVNSFGRGKILGTTDDELKILKTMCQKDNNNFIPRTQEDIQLLASQRILEYQYPKKRYVVHPVLKKILQEANI